MTVLIQGRQFMLHLPSVFLRDLFAAALCASLALTVLTSSAKADVQVTLADGRQITADSVGDESTSESAALQIKNKRATITRWVPWTRIARATLDGTALTGSQLRQRILGDTRDVTSNHVTQVA